MCRYSIKISQRQHFHDYYVSYFCKSFFVNNQKTDLYFSDCRANIELTTCKYDNILEQNFKRYAHLKLLQAI